MNYCTYLVLLRHLGCVGISFVMLLLGCLFQATKAQDASSLNNSGKQKALAGKFQDAIYDFSHAIAYDSLYYTAHYNRANAKYDLNIIPKP
ncbi:MAG: hypothetical protein IPL33_09315 [Sphingobacteriales bacterium]|nr:hypothetical protein [Sphingobacteriales bacterium]